MASALLTFVSIFFSETLDLLSSESFANNLSRAPLVFFLVSGAFGASGCLSASVTFDCSEVLVTCSCFVCVTLSVCSCLAFPPSFLNFFIQGQIKFLQSNQSNRIKNLSIKSIKSNDKSFNQINQSNQIINVSTKSINQIKQIDQSNQIINVSIKSINQIK